MGNTWPCVPALITDIMFSVLLLFCIGYAAGQTCQQAGSKCYSVTTAPLGEVGGSCCNSCRPYIADGQTAWDGTTDWYCQYGSTGGSEGSTCSQYTGSCATGLSCVNGACSSATTTASSSDTTTASSSDTTTAAAATTTVENCNAQAGDVCEDSTYGISKTCCSPYTCESVTSRTKTCQGVSLPANETCFEGGASVGSCASGLICLDGVCKEASTTCADPVLGLCYSADVSRKVADCCSGSYCVQPETSSDSFCMSFSIAEGLQCGDTQAREFRGFCATGNCINGYCSSETTTSTTTTTTTTTTVTTTTATTVPCVASGQTCWGGPGTGNPSECCGSNPSCPLSSKTCA